MIHAVGSLTRPTNFPQQEQRPTNSREQPEDRGHEDPNIPRPIQWYQPPRLLQLFARHSQRPWDWVLLMVTCGCVPPVLPPWEDRKCKSVGQCKSMQWQWPIRSDQRNQSDGANQWKHKLGSPPASPRCSMVLCCDQKWGTCHWWFQEWVSRPRATARLSSMLEDECHVHGGLPRPSQRMWMRTSRQTLWAHDDNNTLSSRRATRRCGWGRLATTTSRSANPADLNPWQLISNVKRICQSDDVHL